MLDAANPEAERRYERNGWQRAGIVPNFALLPHGGFCDTAFYDRRLNLVRQGLGSRALVRPDR